MYGIKDISPQELGISDPKDFERKFESIRDGADTFQQLVNNTSFADIYPEDVIQDIDASINKAQKQFDKIESQADKSYKLFITVPLTPLIVLLAVGVGFLVKAGFDFAKARAALAFSYRIIHGVSSQLYDALIKLEKSQNFITSLNNRDDLNDIQKFEHFEDAGHHDYVLESLKFVNIAINHIDGRTGILEAGISKKILDKRIFKYTKQLKKETDAVFVPMKRGKVPSSSDVETLIVSLTTIIENINDLSSDINRVTNIDLNSTFGPVLYSIIGKHVKFGDV